MEIERKWMVSGWPSEELGLEMLYEQSMRQGYISVRPTVRIREEAMTGGSTEYVLCIKSGAGLVRKEIEMDIPQDKFLELEDLIGRSSMPMDYIESEAKRMCAECLMQNRFIEGIRDFRCSLEESTLICSFTIITTFGEVEQNVTI